jgi:hypothetical protein
MLSIPYFGLVTPSTMQHDNGRTEAVVRDSSGGSLDEGGRLNTRSAFKTRLYWTRTRPNFCSRGKPRRLPPESIRGRVQRAYYRWLACTRSLVSTASSWQETRQNTSNSGNWEWNIPYFMIKVAGILKTLKRRKTYMERDSESTMPMCRRRCLMMCSRSWSERECASFMIYLPLTLQGCICVIKRISIQGNVRTSFHHCDFPRESPLSVWTMIRADNRNDRVRLQYKRACDRGFMVARMKTPVVT